MAGKRTINNPHGFGDTGVGFPTTEDEYVASAAVTAARVVAIGTTGRVAVAATDGTAALVVGYAPAGATAAGGLVKVKTGGIVENIPCNGAVAAGDIVKRSATTAGYIAATATPAIGEALGVAINASASNVVDVFWAKSI
jgi:hypothetical protein